MLKHTVVLGLLMSSSLLFGQLDSNSVTVSANQNTNLQPDQVVFGIYVMSGINNSLDDVLAALKTSGITMANFSGVSTNGTQVVTGLPRQAIQWAFALAVPFAQMKSTVTALTSLEQSVPQANSQLTMTFSVQGTQVSTALQQAQTCNIPGLLAEATAQAQKLTTAGGLTLGQILALASTAPNSAQGNTTASFISGSFSSLLLAPAPQNCSLTVKFAVTRY